MAERVKDVGKVLACVALFIILFFGAGFTEDRSFGLAILLAVVLFWRRLKPSNFEPYWVWIKPNWYQLLLDYGLVENLEEWQQILARIEHISVSDYNVLRDGIKFTVLQPHLVYRDDRREFASSVKFEETLQEVSLISAIGWQHNPSVAIGFASSVPEGAYEIRVTVPHSLNYPNKDENGRVVVALLPWLEFTFYRGEWGEFNERRWGKLRAKLDKRMQEHGWKRDETVSHYNAPASIEHKYLTVQHKRI